MRSLRSAIAGIVALIAGLSPVVAQQYPVVPDQSLIGRIGTGGSSGPAQAIPFSQLLSTLGIPRLPPVYASTYGMKCNGVSDDAPALQRAVNEADALGGATVILPIGTCPIYETVYLNKSAPGGILTVPGLKIEGQGKGVTILDTHVSGGHAIAVNPLWKEGHQALAGMAAATTGTLTTGTYYVQMTINDGLGHEVFLGPSHSVSVTGPTGSIQITLPPLEQPYTGQSYNLYLGTTSTPANYAIVSGGNASAIGPGQTVYMSAIGLARAVPTSPVAIWQNASISGIEITDSFSVVNASGVLCFKCGYANISDVYMYNLTGDGLDIPNYTGDTDGSFVVKVKDSKFDTINGWCVNTVGVALEFSNFTVDNSVFNLCGVAPSNLNTPVTISSIQNNSAPVVTTASSHNLTVYDQVALSVSGMTLSNTWYRVCGTITNNSFQLCDLNLNLINTTSLGSFSSGTVSLSWRPPVWNQSTLSITGSGALAWQGLIATFRNLGFTQNQNVDIYAAENGSSDNLTMEAIDLENTNGKGLYIASLLGGSLNQGECLSTVGDGSTISCMQLGTGFPAGGVKSFALSKMKVRNNTTPAIGFEQYSNPNLTPGTFQDTVSVTDITWQFFDQSGQTRFSGFVFPPIPGTAKFSISAQNTVQLIPAGYGSCLPIHLKSPGEWTCYHVPSAGVTGTVTGSLGAFTTYYCYAYNNASLALYPNTLAFECNSTATSLNEGYAVKATDGTRTFIGTATTDGSGNFQSSGAQTSQYPPQGGNVTVFSGVTDGIPYFTSSTTIGSTAAGTNGQIFNNAAGVPGWVTMSADCTISATGAITCTKTGGVAFTGAATAANGQLPATATNDNAASGKVGEIITGTQATPQALTGTTGGTPLTITSASLTAGDWDCSGTGQFAFAATTVAQTIIASLSTTTNTLGSLGQYNSFNFGTAGIIPNGGFTMSTPTARFSLASPASVFLVAQSGFTTSTATAAATIRCRRPR